MIKSITIQIGGQEIVCSPDEARKLYEELDQIFGSRECHRPHWCPNWITYTNNQLSLDSSGGTLPHPDVTVWCNES